MTVSGVRVQQSPADPDGQYFPAKQEVCGPNGGSLTVDGKAYRATVTITRPSNTTAYTAGDVIGIADAGTLANAGSAIHTLSSIGPSAGYVIVST